MPGVEQHFADTVHWIYSLMDSKKLILYSKYWSSTRFGTEYFIALSVLHYFTDNMEIYYLMLKREEWDESRKQ